MDRSDMDRSDMDRLLYYLLQLIRIRTFHSHKNFFD
jgi:hypothetical protein